MESTFLPQQKTTRRLAFLLLLLRFLKGIGMLLLLLLLHQAEKSLCFMSCCARAAL